MWNRRSCRCAGC
ncbi:hypothetical protein E0H26_21250 [Micromonospora zingiberis]|uniref:Uncharacterized protein n=1 Tax=Micromonospora zingiberis TaxID=2053011 RepID=A0A4R0GE89_9ACTN|nr:hypothetical protein E0H26_21250 [Micromonospora zingiberis]